MVVKTTKTQAVAADISLAAQRWPHRLNDLIRTISDRLARPQTHHTAHDLLRGLLAPLPRKNRWTLSEHVGHPNPHHFQHLLSHAQVNEAGLIEDLRTYARTHPGETRHGPDPGRDRRPEEGHHNGRRSTPIHRYRRAHRECPGRGLPRLHHPRRARPDRPPPLPPPLLDHHPRTPAHGGRSRPHRLRHQTRTRRTDDHLSCGGEHTREVGGRRRGLRRQSAPATNAGGASARVRHGRGPAPNA